MKSVLIEKTSDAEKWIVRLMHSYAPTDVLTFDDMELLLRYVMKAMARRESDEFEVSRY